MTKQKTAKEISTEIANLQAEMSKAQRDAEIERLAKPLTVGEFEAKIELLNSKLSSDTLMITNGIEKDIESNKKVMVFIAKDRDETWVRLNKIHFLITLALLLNSAVLLWAVIR